MHRQVNLEDIYRDTRQECEHDTLNTECDMCWERAFAAMRQAYEKEEKAYEHQKR